MGSIPLPALNVKTPSQPDLLDKYGQLMQLKNMQQQSQLQQQEAPLRLQQLQQGVQSGGLQLQQQQQAQKDQQAVTAAMQQWDGKDITALEPLVLKNGGSGQAVIGLKQKQLELHEKFSAIAKDDAETGAKNLDALKTKGDLVNGALSPLTDPSQVPDAQLPQALTATVQDLTQKGLLDPQHAQAAAQLAQSGNPDQIRQGIGLFSKGFMAQSAIASNAQKDAQTQKDKADAAKTQAETDYYKKNGGAPGVSVDTQSLNSYLQSHPGRMAADFAGFKAGSEAAARQPYELSLAAQKQALSQGDPKAAGQLLVNGDVTLSELKTRGATPDFIARSLFAARQMSGGKYNAQEAESQFAVAKSPANVGFFGSAKSLTDKGGTLDQLATAAKDLPQGQIPVFNTVADAAKAAAGSGPIAKYASILLGVSDDYSKVMGGGNGSDTSRAQALKLIPTNASPEARASAIEGIRGAVGSQLNSRIGSNPVLGRMYGTPVSAPASSGMVTVQIPGSPAGRIPAAALAKFKADHPNAQVQQ